MSIYSTNRSGYATSAVTEGYDNAADIIYESEVNLHRIWECALASDFAHIKAVKEGVILEEDTNASKSDTKAKSGFWAKIGEFFKKLGQKIAALFRAFINKLTQALGTNATLAKRYKSLRDSGKLRAYNGSVKAIVMPISPIMDACQEYTKVFTPELIKSVLSDPTTPNEEFIKGMQNYMDTVQNAGKVYTMCMNAANIDPDDDKAVGGEINNLLGTLLSNVNITYAKGTVKLELGKFMKEFVKKNMAPVPITVEVLDKYILPDLENSKKYIKYCQDMQKNLTKECEDASKFAASMIEKETDVKVDAANVTAIANAIQRLSNVCISASIKMIKASVRMDRVVVGKVLSYINGNNKVASADTTKTEPKAAETQTQTTQDQAQQEAAFAGLVEADVITSIFDGTYALDEAETADTKRILAECNVW